MDHMPVRFAGAGDFATSWLTTAKVLILFGAFLEVGVRGSGPFENPINCKAALTSRN